MTERTGRYVVEFDGVRHEVTVGAAGRVGIGGRTIEASLAAAGPGGARSLLLNGVSVALSAHRGSRRSQWETVLDGRSVAVQVLEAREAEIREKAARPALGAGIAPLKAPMPGLVVRVMVERDDLVDPGTAVLIVEAMKMENELRATAAARVGRVLVSPGDAVEKGQVLAEFEEVDAQ